MSLIWWVNGWRICWIVNIIGILLLYKSPLFCIWQEQYSSRSLILAVLMLNIVLPLRLKSGEGQAWLSLYFRNRHWSDPGPTLGLVWTGGYHSMINLWQLSKSQHVYCHRFYESHLFRIAHLFHYELSLNHWAGSLSFHRIFIRIFHWNPCKCDESYDTIICAWNILYDVMYSSSFFLKHCCSVLFNAPWIPAGMHPFHWIPVE